MIDWTKDLEWKVDGNDWKPADLMCSMDCGGGYKNYLLRIAPVKIEAPDYVLVNSSGNSTQMLKTVRFNDFTGLRVRNKPNEYAFRVFFAGGVSLTERLSAETEKEAFKELLESIILEDVDYIVRLGQKRASESNDSKQAKVIVPENTFSFKVAI